MKEFTKDNLDILKEDIAKANTAVQAITAIRKCYDFHDISKTGITNLNTFMNILNTVQPLTVTLAEALKIVSETKGQDCVIEVEE